MSVNQACFPVATMARVLGVFKAGYYAWVRRPPSAHATADAALLKQVRTVHASSAPDVWGATRPRRAARTWRAAWPQADCTIDAAGRACWGQPSAWRPGDNPA